MELIYLVYQQEEPMRLDKFLVSELEEISRNTIQIYIKDDCVLVNEKIVKANHILKKKDKIQHNNS